jgi:transposase-like protein
MTNVTMKSDSFEPATDTAAQLFDNWFDPIENGVRERVRSFIEELIRCELDAALSRPRYGRAKHADSGPASIVGHRHGSRTRSLVGSFGRTEITVPRARLQTSDGKTTEWPAAAVSRHHRREPQRNSGALRAYQRRTFTADALIASAYLAGTNTRRVRRALAALFRGAVSKDIVSRVWRKVKSDWEAWNARSLAEEPIVRLILDGTAVRVRLDRKATSISLLVVIGVRADGQKVLLVVKHMGSESTEAWRCILDDLMARGLRRPEFLIVDGAPGLEKAIAAVWDGVPVQRCIVHKHRNLLAHAPERLHEEIGADYTDMIYAATPQDMQRAARRSCANGGSSTTRLPTAWRKPAIGCSLLCSCHRANGEAREPRMQSNGCMRSSSAGSKPRPCCPQQRLPPCCSGRCSPPARSTCARSMAGRRSPRRPSISQLTSPLDPITSCRWRCAISNSNTKRDGTVAGANESNVIRKFVCESVTRRSIFSYDAPTRE